MTNDVEPVVILNMYVFKKEKHWTYFFGCHVLHVCMNLFRVPNWPNIGIFLGLGFSSTFGTPPCCIFPGVPTLGSVLMPNPEFTLWM